MLGILAIRVQAVAPSSLSPHCVSSTVTKSNDILTSASSVYWIDHIERQ